MPVQKIYAGSYGIKLTAETKSDLSTAVQVSLIVKKPDGSEVEWVGVINGSTIEYVLQQGDIDIAGKYLIQTKAVFNDGSVIYGQTDILPIYEKFE